MLDDNQTDFLDTFCRAYLLEMVDATKYSKYTGLVDYIVHDATYEQVVLAVFEQRSFLLEQDQDEVEDNIERKRKVEAIEKAVQPVMNFSIAMIAGTNEIEGPVKQAVMNLIRGNPNKMKRYVKQTEGETIPKIELSAIPFLVGKILFVTWEKAESACNVKCRRQVAKTDEYRRMKIKVCASQCEVDSLKKMVSKLKSELNKCNSSDSPKRCNTILSKHITKYQDMLAGEQGRLKRLSDQLNVKVRAARSKDTTAIRPPEVT
jgi:Mg2+ and Co2+ transporter CorA